MSQLSEFQDMVNEMNDDEVLEAAETLMKELGEIQNLKEKIEALEDGLTRGKKAIFYFFAAGLNQEQIDMATGTVIGRRRFLQDMAERKKIKEDVNNPKPEVEHQIACLICEQVECICDD